MAITNITTDQELNEQVLNASQLVIIDFWAPWCGPCKMFGPVFERVSEEIDDVNFVKVNVDEAEDIAAKYNIMSIPTIMLVKNGEVEDQKSGILGDDALKEWLEEHK